MNMSVEKQSFICLWIINEVCHGEAKNKRMYSYCLFGAKKKKFNNQQLHEGRQKPHKHFFTF